MTRTITYQKAINEAIQQEMAADPTVVLFGEDVAGGEGSATGEDDAWGGVLGVTKGLKKQFPDRPDALLQYLLQYHRTGLEVLLLQYPC